MFRVRAVLTAAAFSAVVWGQSGNSTISGNVRDTLDAAISAVKVKTVNVDSGSLPETVTNAAGLYRIGTSLPATTALRWSRAGSRRCRAARLLSNSARPSTSTWCSTSARGQRSSTLRKLLR